MYNKKNVSLHAEKLYHFCDNNYKPLYDKNHEPLYENHKLNINHKNIK